MIEMLQEMLLHMNGGHRNIRQPRTNAN